MLPLTIFFALSSIIGKIGNAGQVNYAASKAGIFGLTKSLAKELGSRNITVNAIAPGALNTGMLQEVLDSGPEKVGKEYYEKAIKQKNSDLL